MFVEEADAKERFAAAGIPIPPGRVAATPVQAQTIAAELAGSVMVKAQVPAGGRGKGGGVAAAADPDAAGQAAATILGTTLGEHTVERVLVEARSDIAAECYLAIMVDTAAAAPVLLASPHGGVDVEQAHGQGHDMFRQVVSMADGPTDVQLAEAAAVAAPPDQREAFVDVAVRAWDVFTRHDAQLVEINPLAVTGAGELIALDAKLVVDDSARFRQPDLPEPRPTGTELERRAADQGFLFVELDGDVGVLANGAGLTMSTIDAVAAHGGAPANFLEVGGMAYTRAAAALDLVLANPRVKSLLVNLCGAYARTDVIAEGLIAGFAELEPDIGVSFCIHGTGEERAQQLVRDELGIEPHDSMDDAVRAAIAHAGEGQR